MNNKMFFTAFAAVAMFLCASCTSNTTKTNEDESAWKKVSSLAEFKQQFKGSTWECNTSSYSQRFEVDATGNRVTMYLNLHMRDRDAWSKECVCTTDIYDGYDYGDGDYIRVRLEKEGDGDSKGVLVFGKDGTPRVFRYLGDDKGRIYLIKK